MMADNDNGVINRGLRNCIKDIFQKCLAAKWKKRLGATHTLGFACGKNYGRDHNRRSDLISGSVPNSLFPSETNRQNKGPSASNRAESETAGATARRQSV